jgi:membrane-associated protease RseP (regulator of RpoE activity)
MRKHASLGWASLGLSMLMLLGGAVAHADDDNGGGGWLGIYSQTLTSELRDGLDYRGDGVLVNRVVSGSPADKAGIEKGDVIVSVNSRSVGSPEQLANLIGSRHAGDEVAIRIVRDGDRKTLNATLASRDNTGDDESGTMGMKKLKDLKGLKELRGNDNDNDNDNNNNNDNFDVPEPPDAPDAPDAPEAPEAPVTPDRAQIRHMIRNGQGMGMFGMASRGRLGVMIEDADGQGDSNAGARVTDVVENSPAKRAGIRTGDVITRVDGTKIESASDLINVVRGKEGRVNIQLERDGERRSVTAELAAGIPGRNRAPQVYEWRGDTSPNGNGAVRQSPGFDKAAPGSDDLRKELDDLREELRQLRRELDDMKNNR